MSKSCFVISVIGDKDSEFRKHADSLLKHLIKPVAHELGYDKVIRADDIDETGSVTVQVVEAIINSDMVIADLSYPNPNVYYELAIRHQTGKPIVQMMQASTSLPFDVRQVRTVPFVLGLDEVEAGKIDLKKKLKAAENDKDQVINPITEAKIIKQLKSENPNQGKVLALLLESQSAIIASIRSLHEELNDPYRRLASASGPGVGAPSLFSSYVPSSWQSTPINPIVPSIVDDGLYSKPASPLAVSLSKLSSIKKSV